MGRISSNLLKKALATWQNVILSTSVACTFWHFRLGMRRNQSFEFLLCRGFFNSFFFFAFAFSPFLIFLLQWSTFYWVWLQFKSRWENIKSGNFCQGVATHSGRECFHSNFWAFLCVFQAPLSRSLWSRYTCRWSQFWSKVMISEVQQRPRLITGGYGWHGSPWVKLWNWQFFWLLLELMAKKL